MSELEDILNHLETTSLEPHDDYTDEFSYKDQKILWKYIKDLQQENQKLKSTLNLYKGSLHREHEAIHRANDLEEENQELKNQQKEYIEQLEKLAYQNMVPSDFTNGCKVAYGIALNRYKEIIGGDNK